MLEKIKLIKHHIIFVGIVIVTLALIFGRSWGNIFAAFTYVSILTPIVIGTVYVFNFILIPRYLLPRHYLKFSLYSLLTVAVSLLLESYLVVFSFILLGHFNFRNVAPSATDTALLFAILYLFVFVTSFFLMFQRLREAHKKIARLTEEQKIAKSDFVEVISNRKHINLPHHTINYIESLSEYIIIHTTDKPIKSNEQISKIHKRLPATFVRIHRSFIVNTNKITFSANDMVKLEDTTLPIGRSYRKEAKTALQIR